MIRIDRQIKRLQRMLDYRKKDPRNDYIKAEITALETAIEALKLVKELNWEHVIEVRKIRRPQ